MNHEAHKRAEVERSAEYWSEVHTADASDVTYWLAVPEVRAAINRRMTGDPDKLFIQKTLEDLGEHWPAQRCLSLGCGSGELERGIVGLGAAAHVDGVDPGEGSIDLARSLAEEHGSAGQIDYHCTSALDWLRGCGSYDLIFCHGVLHHLVDLEEVLELCAEKLRGGTPGLLYVDEYVGPSRDEWDEEDLGFAAGLFRQVPQEMRRTPRVWAPIAMEDPTEMIRSSEIESITWRHFEPVIYQPYYGNVLNPLVCAIRASCTESDPVSTILRAGIELEDWLAERELVKPLYAAFLARPKPLEG